MPILDKLIETKPHANHFKESKKGFIIDIFEIREKLREKACLFEPFDVMSPLPSGDLEAIRNEVVEIVTKTAAGEAPFWDAQS